MVIGIYARKSVFRFNSDSVSVQIQSCKEYAKFVFKDKDIDFRIYDKDEGFSGKNINRPSFTELMDDIRVDKLNVVIVYKLDRISRSVKDFSDTYETMQAHDVTFLSVKESFDTSTPIGRTVMYILAAFAQLERETTAERITDNMHALGAAGHWTGGHLPTGMTSVRKVVNGKEHSYLVTDTESIKLVRYLGELFLSGYSISKLENHCKSKGIKTEAGKYLSASQIYLILSNPVYCCNDPDAYDFFSEKGMIVPDQKLFDGNHGLIAYGKTNQSDTQKKNDSYTIAIGIHEPVFSGADFVRIQQRFGQNKFCRNAKYQIGILKDVLRCTCGCKMEVRTQMSKGKLLSHYYCSKMRKQGRQYCDTGYFSVQKIDDLFIEQLKRIKIDPSQIYIQNTCDTQFSSEKLFSDLKAINTSINNLTKALMDNMESSASGYIISRIEALDHEKKALESAIRKAENMERNQQSAAETRIQINHDIGMLLDNFEDMDYREKNELVKKIVKSCILDNGNLNIIF